MQKTEVLLDVVEDCLTQLSLQSILQNGNSTTARMFLSDFPRRVLKEHGITEQEFFDAHREITGCNKEHRFSSDPNQTNGSSPAWAWDCCFTLSDIFRSLALVLERKI